LDRARAVLLADEAAARGAHERFQSLALGSGDFDVIEVEQITVALRMGSPDS
jgi:hypothetical protein